MWGPVTEPRLSGLAVNDFTHWAFLLALKAWFTNKGYVAVPPDHMELLTSWLSPKSSVLNCQSWFSTLPAPSGQDFWWAYESLQADAQGVTFNLTEHPLVSLPLSNVNYFFLGQAYGSLMVFLFSFLPPPLFILFSWVVET